MSRRGRSLVTQDTGRTEYREILPGWHRAWRHLPRGPRRAVLNGITTALAPRPGTNPPPVIPGAAVAGELRRASGLGEGARLMLRALEQLQLPAHPLRLGNRGAALPPPRLPLVVHANAPQMAAALLGLPRTLPRHRRVIGYWAWDLPVVPASWRAGQRFVHEVWVPSRFTRDALAAMPGLRLRVVPHPVAIGAATARPDRARFGIAPDAVVVLVNFSLASSFERKNPLGMLSAFRAAFGNRPDRQLFIKLGSAAHFPNDHDRLRAAAAECPNVTLATETLQDAEMRSLTASCDIVLSLHRAEGFGLVPAQAMLAGIPVIATGWSGNMDYMDASSAALVGYELIPARDPRGVFEAPSARWADPDEADAVAHLRRLADDPSVRRALGAAGAIQARKTLGTAALQDALADLQDVAPQP